MSLAHRDPTLVELMDDPACDPIRLRRTLSRFRIVNRVVSGWGGVYRTHVRPALARCPGPEARILDIGCGGGDVLRRMVSLARADGFTVTGLGIDPDPRVLEVAHAARPMPGVHYREAYAGELVAEGSRFTVVISNHLMHHLDGPGFSEMLRDSAALASDTCVHSDIARSRIAYAAYATGITPLAPGSFLRTDGLRSIRRSYRRDELEAVLPQGWHAPSAPRFRVLAVYRAGGDR